MIINLCSQILTSVLVETIIVTPMLAVLTLMEVFRVRVFLGILEMESTAKV